MKKALLLATVLFTLNACSSVSEKAEEAIGEKIASELLGVDIDVENYSEESIDANSAKINLDVDGNSLFSKDKSYRGSVMLYEETMAIQITDEEEGQIMIGVSGKDMYTQTPLVARVETGQQPDTKLTGSVMISKLISEESAVTYMFKEGEVKVTQLSKEAVTVEVNGVVAAIGSLLDANKPENLQKISGSVTINQPVMTSMGVELENIMY